MVMILLPGRTNAGVISPGPSLHVGPGLTRFCTTYTDCTTTGLIVSFRNRSDWAEASVGARQRNSNAGSQGRIRPKLRKMLIISQPLVPLAIATAVRQPRKLELTTGPPRVLLQFIARTLSGPE